MKIGRHVLKGDHIKTAKKIQTWADKTLVNCYEPVILAIDPASRSIGYSLYSYNIDTWVLEGSGSFEAKGDIHQRLAAINIFLTEFDPDAVAIEYIGGSTGHRYLSWACGAIVSTFPEAALFEIKTNLWKKFAGKEWVKGDEADAIAIGKCVTEIIDGR